MLLLFILYLYKYINVGLIQVARIKNRGYIENPLNDSLEVCLDIDNPVIPYINYITIDITCKRLTVTLDFKSTSNFIILTILYIYPIS